MGLRVAEKFGDTAAGLSGELATVYKVGELSGINVADKALSPLLNILVSQDGYILVFQDGTDFLLQN
jgi:hypothetical protein